MLLLLYFHISMRPIMHLFHVLIHCCHLFINCMLKSRWLTQHAIKNQLFHVSALQWIIQLFFWVRQEEFMYFCHLDEIWWLSEHIVAAEILLSSSNKAVHVIIPSTDLLSFCQLHVEIKRQIQHAVIEISCSIYLLCNESFNCCFVCVKRRSCSFVILMRYDCYQITDEWWQAMHKLFENMIITDSKSKLSCMLLLHLTQLLSQIYKSNQFIASIVLYSFFFNLMIWIF